ncbi:cactin-like [Oryza glaberrima]|uniref:cactin-like n=1 Tax=Oryza glaberrima TaxID=4538 RepID=UPI00224C4986|nr:cactin-like [Oryza glaberrima]
MAKPRPRAEEISRPSRSLSKAVRRRADAVSAKLAARGLGAFVWLKKLERDLARGILPDIVSLRDERRRCLARRREAAGVNASAAASRRRSPPPILDASRARAAAEEEAKEAAFLLDQSRLRAEARFASGRPKPIDVLVKANEPFWAVAKAMCNAEIEQAATGTGTAGHSDRALHSAVFADVKSVVEGKSLDELDAMQHAIAARMATGEAKVVEHWQEVTELIRFEWNKYNRAHYDHDHPPPKTVKGYKFVLYYPDLAGGKPPQYTVDEDGSNSGGGETCVIRFHAGWPYEDVAFRIVNKEWEYSRKAGFRCTFDTGVLHLNFQFKRFFYRR